jgi:hypothetical protein
MLVARAVMEVLGVRLILVRSLASVDKCDQLLGRPDHWVVVDLEHPERRQIGYIIRQAFDSIAGDGKNLIIVPRKGEF